MKNDKPDFKTVLLTPVFRLSYPNVWAPKFNQLAKRDQYDIQMIFSKVTDREALKPMVELMNKLVVHRWGTKPEGFQNPFKDGDTMKNSAGELLKVKSPALEGSIVLSSWSKLPPGVMDLTGKNPITQHDEIYGGCYCRAQLNAFAYPPPGKTGYKPGVSFGLLNIQKVRDGEAFGNRTRPEDAFTPVEGAGESQAEVASVDSMFS